MIQSADRLSLVRPEGPICNSPALRASLTGFQHVRVQLGQSRDSIFGVIFEIDPWSELMAAAFCLNAIAPGEGTFNDEGQTRDSAIPHFSGQTTIFPA